MSFDSGRDDIIKAIQENPAVIVMGETGSGKTTRMSNKLSVSIREPAHFFLLFIIEIPQFIKEAGMISDKFGGVAITQPRRVAAVNLAKRVAEETVTKLGGQVNSSDQLQLLLCSLTLNRLAILFALTIRRVRIQLSNI